MEKRKSKPSNRIFGLDVIRALAIIFVVMGHGAFLIDNTPIEGFPYLRLIDGVDLFFVLSGFLIGGILLKLINKPEGLNYSQLLIFWKRRWFRTLPNYYLILILNAVFAYFQINTTDFSQFDVSFFLFLQNFSSPFSGFFWESWSLSIEEWFYVFTPIILFFLLSILKPKKAFLLSTLIMILVPTLIRVYGHTDTLSYWQWDIGVRKMVFTRLDSIGYGLLAAWILYYYPRFWNTCRWPAVILGLAANYFVTHYVAEPNTFFRQVLVFSTSSLTGMLLLPMAYSIKSAKGFLGRLTTHISKISYSMYLLHFGIIALTIKKHFYPVSSTDGIIKYFIYWTLTLILSTFLYRYYELPMTNLRDRSLKKQASSRSQ